MAVSASYLSFVLEQLGDVRDIVTKRMFGGVGIYSGGTFFAVIDNDTLFFKVDDGLAGRYQERGMPQFAPIPGAKPMNYFQVPPEIIEDAAELAEWARESVRVALDPKKRAPAAKKPRR